MIPSPSASSLLMGLALSSYIVSTYSAGPGALECPCLLASNPLFSQVRTELVSNGYPATYGLEGCVKYDEDATDCQQDPRPEFCAAEWCYVDPTTCAVNEAECLAADKLIGAEDHVACRSRGMETRLATNVTAVYSYQTCGALNSYDDDRISDSMANRVIITTTTETLPWVKISKPSDDPADWIYGGVEVAFFRNALLKHSPAPDLVFKPEWATDQSKALFSSSYTSCVHDVAVGTYDICVGDFWLTPERMLMAAFLPAVRTDHFYLVMPKQDGSLSFVEMIEFPFKPFTPGAWGLIFLFIMIKAAVHGFTDWDNTQEFKYTANQYYPRVFKAMYLAWAMFLSKQLNVFANSVPAKMAALGYQFFILLIIAFYTANLTSMLVVQKTTGKINSLDDAIAQKLTICVTSAALQNVMLNYPTGDFFDYGGSSAEFARNIHAGNCDAAIIHHPRIWQLHAGMIQEGDCNDVADGVSEDIARCEKGYDGQTRDDCKLQRVGESVMTIPIAFPVSNELYQPLAWAITSSQAAGEWQSMEENNQRLYPQSQCALAENEETALDTERIAGVLIITALFFFVALIIWAIELKLGVRAEALLTTGDEVHYDTDEQILNEITKIQRMLQERRKDGRKSEENISGMFIDDTCVVGELGTINGNGKFTPEG